MIIKKYDYKQKGGKNPLLIKTIIVSWLKSYATAKKLLAGGRGDEMARSYLLGSQQKQVNRSFNKIPGERKRGQLQSILRHMLIPSF